MYLWVLDCLKNQLSHMFDCILLARCLIGMPLLSYYVPISQSRKSCKEFLLSGNKNLGDSFPPFVGSPVVSSVSINKAESPRKSYGDHITLTFRRG